LDANESVIDTVTSKLDTVTTATANNFSQFHEYMFLKTSGESDEDGNDVEELATTNATGTSYSIMASKTIGEGMNSHNTSYARLDIGWTGQVSGTGTQTGNSKIMVVSGSVATLTGAVDITDEISETSTKNDRWRSGYIQLPVMAEIPYTVMLVGKVASAGDTLTCTGYAGSTIFVLHEQAPEYDVMTTEGGDALTLENGDELVMENPYLE
jgi:hypothetical protein